MSPVARVLGEKSTDTIDINPRVVRGRTGSGVGNTFARIESSADINVVVFMKESSSTCSAYTAYPTNTLGVQYFVTGPRGTREKSIISYIGSSQFRSTQVQIRLPNRDVEVMVNGNTYRRNDVFNVQVQNNEDLQLVATRGDFRSTAVEVLQGDYGAVFSGFSNTNVGNTGQEDTLLEQLTPTNSWGTEFLIAPNPSRGKYYYAVSFLENGKSLYVNGGGRYTSQFAGDVWEGVGNNNELLYVTTKNNRNAKGSPISVSLIYGGEDNSQPSMIVVPPIEQFTNKFLFVMPTNGFARVIIEKGYRSNLRLNNREYNGNSWQSFSNLNWETSIVNLSTGRNSITLTGLSNNQNRKFAVYVYGSDRDCAYAFSAGMCLSQLNVS